VISHNRQNCIGYVGNLTVEYLHVAHRPISKE
jgi:hypothetical protein